MFVLHFDTAVSIRRYVVYGDRVVSGVTTARCGFEAEESTLICAFWCDERRVESSQLEDSQTPMWTSGGNTTAAAMQAADHQGLSGRTRLDDRESGKKLCLMQAEEMQIPVVLEMPK